MSADPIRARLDALAIRQDYFAETHVMKVDRALRAVLDLHRQGDVVYGELHYCGACTDWDSAFGGVVWPCATVEAIADALGVAA